MIQGSCLEWEIPGDYQRSSGWPCWRPVLPFWMGVPCPVGIPGGLSQAPAATRPGQPHPACRFLSPAPVHTPHVIESPQALVAAIVMQISICFYFVLNSKTVTMPHVHWSQAAFLHFNSCPAFFAIAWCLPISAPDAQPEHFRLP